MVNEEINTKIHKLYDRKNEIKLCVRDFFFFFASASSLQPAANRSRAAASPTTGGDGHFDFLKSEAAPSRTPPVTLPPAAPPTKGSFRHISSHRQLVANSTRRFPTRESTS